MRETILTTDDVVNYKVNNFMEDLYRIRVVPLIREQARRIDDDIRECIKEEIKKYGSIVKRYGDWAKFINKEMIMAHYSIDPKYPFYQTLFYRGKRIRDYVIRYASQNKKNYVK